MKTLSLEAFGPGRVCSYYVPLVRPVGLDAAIVLSTYIQSVPAELPRDQLWHATSGPETRKATGLSRERVDRARDRLVDDGLAVIGPGGRGHGHKTLVRVDLAAVHALLREG